MGNPEVRVGVWGESKSDSGGEWMQWIKRGVRRLVGKATNNGSGRSRVP